MYILDVDKYHKDVLQYNNIYYDYVIYCSGETKKTIFMKDLNFLIPKFLYQSLSFRKYIYFNSLSIFEGNYNEFIGCESDLKPISIYGKTKSLFKNFSIGKSDIINLYPASFYSGNGRSSIEKFENLFNKFFFLRLLKFPGLISYVPIIDIYSSIYIIIRDDISKDVFISKYFRLSDFSYKYSFSLFFVRKVILKFNLLRLNYISYLLKTLFLRVKYEK